MPVNEEVSNAMRAILRKKSIINYQMDSFVLLAYYNVLLSSLFSYVGLFDLYTNAISPIICSSPVIRNMAKLPISNLPLF